MMRLQRIDPLAYPKLDALDTCFHLGEYTAGGGFGVSQTNQQIINLKKRPPVPLAQVRWKQAAIRFWGDSLAEAINLEAAEQYTFVPAPCSRLPNAADYDDRMQRVLARMHERRPALDVRNLVITACPRASQHESGRLSVAELQASMAINPAALTSPLKSGVIIVDDVFTQGGTFKAMKNLISPLPGVEQVSGVFLARTVWPEPDFSAIFGVLVD